MGNVTMNGHSAQCAQHVTYHIRQQHAMQAKGVSGTKDDLFGLEQDARKRTEEGYNIYSEQELQLNKTGGNTDLCPFDCDCCF